MQYIRLSAIINDAVRKRGVGVMRISEELIDRCRRGDRRALGELYSACRGRLLAVCAGITGDGAAAEDVLHDGFIVIMGNIGRLRDSSRAWPWMCRIVANLALRHREAASRSCQLGGSDGVVEAEENGGQPALTVEELLDMIDSLPEGYGRVFRLSVLDGLSHDEIAALLGIAARSSSSQLCRARAFLRRLVAARVGRVVLAVVLLLSASALLLLRRSHPGVRQDRQQGVAQSGPRRQNVSSEAGHGRPAGVALAPAAAVRKRPSAAAELSGEAAGETLRPVNAAPLPRPAVPVLSAVPMPESFAPAETHAPSAARNAAPGCLKLLPSLVSAGGLSAGSLVAQTLRAVGGVGSATRGDIETWEQLNHYLTYDVGDGMDPVLKDALIRISMGNEGRISTRRSFDAPLTVGLGLSRRVGKNWEIETGLRLTRLGATLQTGGSDTTNITARQKVWYVGVPLGATYTVLSRGRWRLYATAGMALDVPFKATARTSFNVNNKSVLTRASRPALPPVQLSVTAGAGVGCELWPHVELYFSPGLTWHVPADRAATPTLWTEKPLQLSLPVGIRLRY